MFFQFVSEYRRREGVRKYLGIHFGLPLISWKYRGLKVKAPVKRKVQKLSPEGRMDPVTVKPCSFAKGICPLTQGSQEDLSLAGLVQEPPVSEFKNEG